MSSGGMVCLIGYLCGGLGGWPCQRASCRVVDFNRVLPARGDHWDQRNGTVTSLPQISMAVILLTLII